MKNSAASIRDRLLNLSRRSGEPMNALLERYAMGRLLYRLAKSDRRNEFVLKGAQLFRVWEAVPHRPTRDLDLLGLEEGSEDSIETLFTQLVRLPVQPVDGLQWGKVRAKPIRDNTAYGGVRATLPALLAGARISLRIDVGFGDVITPGPVEAQWGELLDFPAARLLVYPPETVVAEKLETMVSLGRENSRMKDFYDLHWLSLYQSFDGDLLVAGVEATFRRRNTKIPAAVPVALTEEFSGDTRKLAQWDGFRLKSEIEAAGWKELLARLASFLTPILSAEARGRSWNPETGWTAGLS